MSPTTMNTDLFRTITTLKAKGLTWDDIANKVQRPIDEVERLPWCFQAEWREQSDFAQQLVCQEVIAQTIATIQASLLATDDIRLRTQVANTLVKLVQLQQPKTQKLIEPKALKANKPKPEALTPLPALPTPLAPENPPNAEPLPAHRQPRTVQEFQALMDEHEQRMLAATMQPPTAPLPKPRSEPAHPAKSVSTFALLLLALFCSRMFMVAQAVEFSTPTNWIETDGITLVRSCHEHDSSTTSASPDGDGQPEQLRNSAHQNVHHSINLATNTIPRASPG